MLEKIVTTKTPLRYPGGKTRAIAILEARRPQEITHVLSPFFGGGSYELYLTGQGIRVEAHDAFPQLVNFWEHLLANSVGLEREIRNLMPVGKANFKMLQEKLSSNPEKTLTDAARFFVVNRCSFSGATLSGGYSSASESGRLTDSVIERVKLFNNPLITVSDSKFENSLQDGYDFIFADPPYLLPVEASNKLYGVDGSLHSSFNHMLFSEQIKQIKSPWLITYNDSTEVRRLFRGFNIESVSWSYGMNSTKESSEIIITNY